MFLFCLFCSNGNCRDRMAIADVRFVSCTVYNWSYNNSSCFLFNTYMAKVSNGYFHTGDFLIILLLVKLNNIKYAIYIYKIYDKLLIQFFY